jgi:GxxExxY protein
MNTDESAINELAGRVIGYAFRVANTLGCGFLEKAYENALAHEIRKAGLRASQQHVIAVVYDGTGMGEYAADLLVEDPRVVELKCARAFDQAHIAQCLNYLKATGHRVCLLLNFGSIRLEVRRISN